MICPQGQDYAAYLLRIIQKPRKMMTSPPKLHKNQDSREWPTMTPSPKAIAQHPCIWLFLHIKTPPAYCMQGVFFIFRFIGHP